MIYDMYINLQAIRVMRSWFGTRKLCWECWMLF